MYFMASIRTVPSADIGIVLFQAVVLIERIFFPWSAEEGRNL
jgi:hypothetical protein